MQTLLELLKKTEEYLKKNKVEKPRLEAERIFSQSLNIDRITLYTQYDRILTNEEKNKIKTYINDTKIKSGYLKDIFDSSIEYLKKYKIDEARLIAELIFSNILKIDRMLLFMNYDKNITDKQKNDIREALKKIAIDKLPYQYLINQQNFYGRNFYVNKGVLIPRYDTECLVENVIKNLKIKAPFILDIGTGSGAIAITLGLEIPESKVLGIDISDKAIEISKKNRDDLGAKNVKFVLSDLFENVNFKSFDIIVSNPPYISNDEIALVSEQTYIHEPKEALFANADGLYFYYLIAEKARDYLKNEGMLAFEIGFNQAEAVKNILLEFSYKDIRVIKDLDSHDRVILCKYEGRDDK